MGNQTFYVFYLIENIIIQDFNFQVEISSKIEHELHMNLYKVKDQASVGGHRQNNTPKQTKILTKKFKLSTS